MDSVLIVALLYGWMLIAFPEAAARESVEESGQAYFPGGLEAFADRGEPISMGLGTVGDVDFDGPTVMIDGLRFGFAADAEVRLLDGFGAPTLLRTGMAVEYYWAQASGEHIAGRILAIQQVGEGVVQQH
jgi:hypothetical protein